MKTHKFPMCRTKCTNTPLCDLRVTIVSFVVSAVKYPPAERAGRNHKGHKVHKQRTKGTKRCKLSYTQFPLLYRREKHEKVACLKENNNRRFIAKPPF